MDKTCQRLIHPTRDQVHIPPGLSQSPTRCPCCGSLCFCRARRWDVTWYQGIFLQLLQEHIIPAHPAHALHYVTPPCCGAAHSGCTVGWPVQLLTAPPCSPAQCLYPSLGWILLRSLLDFEKAHIPRCSRVYHRRLATMLSILPPDAIVP